jgi:uncharacterized protein (TIGR04255 family)
MKKSWPTLKKPPILLAVAELRFRLHEKFDVLDLKRNDMDLFKKYPTRSDNFAGNINMPGPTAGLSTATIDSRQVGYTYANADNSRKVIISKENLVYIQEGKYTDWTSFKNEWSEIVGHFSAILSGLQIERVSIRFINQFVVTEMTSPLDYFNTSISAKDGVIKYPVDLYFFRYILRIPDTAIRVIVANTLQEITNTNFTFIFDIDVLNDEHFKFDIERLSNLMEDLREVKNETFFNNITEKTLTLIS